VHDVVQLLDPLPYVLHEVCPGPDAGREDEHAGAEPREGLFSGEHGGDGAEEEGADEGREDGEGEEEELDGGEFGGGLVGLGRRAVGVFGWGGGGGRTFSTRKRGEVECPWT
jgi:hypothetical protein